MDNKLTNYKLHLKRDWPNSLSWIRIWILLQLLSVLYVKSSVIKSSDSEPKFTFLHKNQEHFANSLAKYEISIPTRVTPIGDYFSHSVHHRRSRHRQRRDVSDNDDANTNYDVTDTKMHFRMEVDGTDMVVELETNHRLLGPGFVVERRPRGYQNIANSNITARPFNECHFIGHIKGFPDSKVAFATCAGLHGYLLTPEKGLYMIEPIKGHPYTEGGPHPHLVYHRSALPPHLDIHTAEGDKGTKRGANNGSEPVAGCGVKETYENSVKEREAWEKENGISTAPPSRLRSRRSVSVERYVETMVVVDREMMEFYENEDIVTYVLTVMNMVSMLYHDSTLGNLVNIQLVNLMLMDYDEEELEITHHADNTLRSFCKWQKNINAKEENGPTHHDVAILFTRRNICAKMNEPCSTLGLSQVNGLCQPHRSCNVNEDTGLSLAFTVAHELGHNFGMEHDGENNDCSVAAEGARHGEVQLLMQAQLNAEAAPMIWSSCSRAAITKFLDRDWGYCLTDEATKHDFTFDARPPGIIYDADHQCRLQYGQDAEHCKVDNLCVTLWCKVKNKCMTRLEAAAEGTICGDNMWCSGGRCVPQGESPLATNGEWGEWGAWSECSRSCGAGVAYRERHCDNPPPKNGGAFCLGERKRYRTCNTEDCPEESMSFKNTQCKEFNNTPYKGKFYDWEYVANPRTPCQLHCRPRDQFFSVMLADMVKDGTPCPILGRHAMCISGICRHVGCDWLIDSPAKEDHCGVCRGDGTSCKTVTTHFDEAMGMGYVEAMVIPQGARNIRIEEVAEANNYLAVRNNNGEYYLNGGWFIQWNGEYEAGGTVLTYQRVGDREILKAPGPLKESLHIMLLFQSENPGVEFQYTIPNDNATSDRRLEFRWIFLDWTHCTRSCGGGTQWSEVVCSEIQDGIVDDMFCDLDTRSEDMYRVCNDHLCPPRWWVGPWQHCSQTCGDGGVRMRTVLCVCSSGNDVQEALEEWQCEGQQKPITTQACSHKPVCPPTLSGVWTTGQWSQCTRSCGGGLQIRDVTCLISSAVEDTAGTQTTSCNEAERPVSQQDCSTQQCPRSAGLLDQGGRGLGGSRGDTGEIGDETANARSTTTDIVLYNRENLQQNQHNMDVDIHNDDLEINTANKGSSFSTTTSIPTPSVEQLHNGRHTKNPRLENGGKVLDMFQKVNLMQDTPTVTGAAIATSTQPPDIFIWVPMFWEQCPTSCGSGIRTRPVRCFHSVTSQEVPEELCHGQTRPSDQESCNEHECLPWDVSKWGECSETCGDGTSRRLVTCPISDQCDPSSKPRDHKPCNIKSCVDWYKGAWSECTQSCDGGQMERNVTCIDLRTNSQSDECSMLARPAHSSRCAMQPCAQANAASGRRQHCDADILSQNVCLSLRRMGRCPHHVVQLKCCRTCQMPSPNQRSGAAGAYARAGRRGKLRHRNTQRASGRQRKRRRNKNQQGTEDT